MKVGLTIGELAGELHLNPKTIRYYEEVGLLPEPRRSESGYRLYSRYEMERLRLVKRTKLLGLSLTEIKEIVEYAIDGCCSVMEDRLLALVEAKLGEIDQKIEDLVTFRDNLRQYYSELSSRLESETHEECKTPAPASCQCLGEEVDSFRE
jgi:DNA-binding transcriptional MerR regulator